MCDLCFAGGLFSPFRLANRLFSLLPIGRNRLVRPGDLAHCALKLFPGRRRTKSGVAERRMRPRPPKAPGPLTLTRDGGRCMKLPWMAGLGLALCGLLADTVLAQSPATPPL